MQDLRLFLSRRAPKLGLRYTKRLPAPAQRDSWFSTNVDGTMMSTEARKKSAIELIPIRTMLLPPTGITEF